MLLHDPIAESRTVDMVQAKEANHPDWPSEVDRHNGEDQCRALSRVLLLRDDPGPCSTARELLGNRREPSNVSVTASRPEGVHIRPSPTLGLRHSPHAAPSPL